MSPLPVLETPRLLLRGFVEEDAPRVRTLAGDRRVADTTLLIPHPYPEGAAEAWIVTHEAEWELGRGLTLAVTLRGEGRLIGAMGLSLDPAARAGELGYWIAVEEWGRGYCTEAARALIAHAFDRLGLERVTAHHFVRNPASGRVMEKLGMRPGRIEPAGATKWGRAEDLRHWSIERPDRV